MQKQRKSKLNSKTLLNYSTTTLKTESAPTQINTEKALWPLLRCVVSILRKTALSRAPCVAPWRPGDVGMKKEANKDKGKLENKRERGNYSLFVTSVTVTHHIYWISR